MIIKRSRTVEDSSVEYAMTEAFSSLRMRIIVGDWEG